MSRTTYRVKLSEVEVRHLLHLLDHQRAEGWYWGNKKQHDARLARITSKLTHAQKS